MSPVCEMLENGSCAAIIDAETYGEADEPGRPVFTIAPPSGPPANPPGAKRCFIFSMLSIAADPLPPPLPGTSLRTWRGQWSNCWVPPKYRVVHGQSGCTLSFVDIKTKVPSQYTHIMQNQILNLMSTKHSIQT